MQGDALDKAEQGSASICIEEYRRKLKDLSWFMTAQGCANAVGAWMHMSGESLKRAIAREANKEDGCTGHFWSRFFAPAKSTFPTSI